MPTPLGTHWENGALIPDEVNLATEPIVELVTRRTHLDMNRRKPLGEVPLEGEPWDVMVAVCKDDPRALAEAIIVRNKKDAYGVVSADEPGRVVLLDSLGNRPTHIDLGDGLGFSAIYDADRNSRLNVSLDPNAPEGRLYETVAAFPESNE